MITRLLIGCVLLLATVANCPAVVIYDEAVSGDLDGDLFQVTTPLSLGGGPNEVIGTISRSSVTQTIGFDHDAIVFRVPPGGSVSRYEITFDEVVRNRGIPGFGEFRFVAIAIRPYPAGRSAGRAHFFDVPEIGADSIVFPNIFTGASYSMELDTLSGINNVGSGVVTPLGPGDYIMTLTTRLPTSIVDYAIDYTISFDPGPIPEPSTAALLVTVLAACHPRRSRFAGRFR